VSELKAMWKEIKQGAKAFHLIQAISFNLSGYWQDYHIGTVDVRLIQ